MGVFWKRANHQGALAAIITGIVGSVLFLIAANTRWIPEIHFLYTAGILFVACSFSLIVVSLFTSPPAKEKIKDITWSGKVYKNETIELKQFPFYKNYRVQAAALMIMMVIILIIFR